MWPAAAGCVGFRPMVFGACTELVVSAKLAELGYRASPALWGITEP